MAPPKAELKLEGQCNRCGLCCTVEVGGGKTLYCHNLQKNTYIGLPGASTCRMYGQRYPGMPIMLNDKDDNFYAMGACMHGTSIEPEIIAPWIGRGCSLRIANGK